MSIKYILVQFSDRTWWKIPANIIAESRAKYFAQIDFDRQEGKYEDLYKDGYEYTINSEEELEDWAKNSMNWSDVKDYAIQDSGEDIDYEMEWCNVDFDFIKET